MNGKAAPVETGFGASFSTNKRNDDMKKSLFMTAVLVALVGCSKSNSSRMGGPAARESETVTSSTADTTSVRAEPMDVTKDVGDKSGSGSIREGLSGAAAGSIDTARTAAPSSQGQDNQQKAPNTTGDRSDGDLSNRPAGAPALGDQGSASSTNIPSQNDNSGNAQSPDQSQQQQDQKQQTPQ